MEEVWRDVKHYEDFYEVSNLGRVRAKQTRKICSNQFVKNNMEHEGDILPQGNNGRGYQIVSLHGVRGTELKGTREYVHRLVAMAFIPNPENKPQVDHIDCCRSNNEATNLRWVTQSENEANPITKAKKLALDRSNWNYATGTRNGAYTHPEKNFFRNNPHYCKGRTSPTKGLHWFNNGVTNVVCSECPEGYVRGRI